MKLIKKSNDTKNNVVLVKQDDTNKTPFNPARIRSWTDYFKKKDVSRQILINMDLRNGKVDRFVIEPKDETFVYRGGQYIIDTTLMYEDINAKMYALDYVQDFTIPLKRKVDINDLRNSIPAIDGMETETAINPQALAHFMKSEVIERVLQGAELDKAIRFIKIVIIVILVIATIHFFVMLKASGVLSSIRLPF